MNTMNESSSDNASTRYFDGVICFGGEDWWYHNRGHFDMRIMRELRSRMPVLYVNSIGMRTPRMSEGRMFFKRVSRKLKSLRRGLVHVDRNFSVVSPFVAPSGALHSMTTPFLPMQVRLAARRCGISRPLLWVNRPTAAEVVEKCDPVAVVYQRTDRYESYEGIDHAWVAECDAYLKARADLTVFCSSLLLSEESGECRESCFVDHGVNASDFRQFKMPQAFQHFVALTFGGPILPVLGRRLVKAVLGLDQMRRQFGAPTFQQFFLVSDIHVGPPVFGPIMAPSRQADLDLGQTRRRVSPWAGR